MAAGRSLKPLVGRRRRVDEEGEDEDGPGVVMDSQSEDSVFSGLADDDDDASSLEELNPGAAGQASAHEKTGEDAPSRKTSAKKPRKARRKSGKKQVADPAASNSQPSRNNFKNAGDTDVMMNGLKIDDPTLESMDFASTDKTAPPVAAASARPAGSNGHADPAFERQKRDHEDYRRRRDADPAFIPIRGNFFMHDTRTQNGPGTLPVRGAYSGKGRGVGGPNIGGPFSPANQMAQAERGAEQPWKHDLHETINQDPGSTAAMNSTEGSQVQYDPDRLNPKSTAPSQSRASPAQSLSRTTLVGRIQIRVFFPGMKSPVTFSDVPWKQYTRLPDHRPPLRRDKPVRVALPYHDTRHIFPSPERSFIFIPRQMRPNQQNFGRNNYQRSVGGYGMSSRRTSTYGGSMYAASVAASRRSSFASVTRESPFSPVGSFAGSMPPTRPVVRLPHNRQHPMSASSTPLRSLSRHRTPTGMQVHTFPLPQQPTFQGTPTTTVHQPRPQKAISVTGIESPAILQPVALPPDSRPFQNQLPAHMHEQMPFAQPPPPYFSPRLQYAYPQQQPTGTPLSGIPEQAMLGPGYQSNMHPFGQPPFYAQYSQQQGYYFPNLPYGYQPMPVYAPPPQNYASPPGQALASPFVSAAPTVAHRPDEDPQQSPQQSLPQQPQSGMVAHESNGMVYYLPAAEAQQQARGETYQPAEGFVPSYAMPGLPPPTPAPEAAYYYPPNLPLGGMQQVGSGTYYPAQPPPPPPQ